MDNLAGYQSHTENAAAYAGSTRSELILKFNIRKSTLIFTMLTLPALCTPSLAAQQQLFHNALSLQGYTGVLNTPSAHVTDEGWMYALYPRRQLPPGKQPCLAGPVLRGN